MGFSIDFPQHAAIRLCCEDGGGSPLLGTIPNLRTLYQIRVQHPVLISLRVVWCLLEEARRAVTAVRLTSR